MTLPFSLHIHKVFRFKTPSNTYLILNTMHFHRPVVHNPVIQCAHYIQYKCYYDTLRSSSLRRIVWYSRHFLIVSCTIYLMSNPSFSKRRQHFSHSHPHIFFHPHNLFKHNSTAIKTIFFASSFFLSHSATRRIPSGAAKYTHSTG